MGEQERRRHFRLAKDTVITCQAVTYPLGSEPEVEVRMVDVSEGGVGFDAEKPFELGMPVQLALRLQGWHRYTSGFFKHGESDLSRPLTAVGRVVRCGGLAGGGYEIGVEFVDIWDDHWRAMRTLLEKERAAQEAQGQ